MQLGGSRFPSRTPAPLQRHTQTAQGLLQPEAFSHTLSQYCPKEDLVMLDEGPEGAFNGVTFQMEIEQPKKNLRECPLPGELPGSCPLAGWTHVAGHLASVRSVLHYIHFPCVCLLFCFFCMVCFLNFFNFHVNWYFRLKP